MKSALNQEFSESPSPFMQWLKPVIRKAEFGSLTMEYIIRKEMTNPMGVLHGGITAGIIDDIIGATVFTMNLSNPFTTINNAIDYFSPAKEGDVIQAHTTIIKRGVQIINLQCEVWLPAKKRLIARGYSNMIRLEVR
ncbi:MAG: PaaI family thioesterase [Daejeonella sp.]